MLNFKTTIPHDSSMLDVNFNQVVAPNRKFFIEVCSPSGKFTCFEMQADLYNHWQVIHPVEDWIMDLQNQLSSIIKSRLPD